MSAITSVYIDGFNLYNGLIKGTRLHWLDLVGMSRLLLPDHDIRHVRYFTAIVSDRPDDPQKSLRQLIYHRALSTFPEISIKLGQFTTHSKFLPLADTCRPGIKRKFVCVRRTEEKGSDVNLATWLLHDAHMNRFDSAVVISNDSDLLAPIQIIRTELRKQVGVVNPHKHPSKQLAAHADFVLQLRHGLLEKCRLPNILHDARGEIRCPQKWL